ncbi:MAG TPA: sigma factor [Ignavibacteria bacterium]|nr:sigma factor [Ignavibacteria bacterium]
MLTEISAKNFIKFRNKLLSFSRQFNISHEDAEEIVNDSIMKALDYFDNDRGSFEGLCKVIIKNKIFNFKRDNVHLLILIVIDEDEDIIDTDFDSIEDKENNVFALTFLNKLKKLLDKDELNLLEEIYKTCDSLNKISISKASANIGLKPLKGWDIFRKIQRKAKTLQGKKLDLTLSRIGKIEEPNSVVLYRRGPSSEIYNQFTFLNEDHIKKLNSIYDNTSQ